MTLKMCFMMSTTAVFCIAALAAEKEWFDGNQRGYEADIEDNFDPPTSSTFTLPSTSAPATTTAQKRHDLAEMTEELFDPAQPHGLNLQEVVNNQHRRRAHGIGYGFTTDVILLARHNDLIHQWQKSLAELQTRKVLAEKAIKLSEKNKKKDKKLEKKSTDETPKNNLLDIEKEIDNIQKMILVLQESGVELKANLMKKGMTQTQIDHIPSFSTFPKSSVKE